MTWHCGCGVRRSQGRSVLSSPTGSAYALIHTQRASSAAASAGGITSRSRRKKFQTLACSPSRRIATSHWFFVALVIIALEIYAIWHIIGSDRRAECKMLWMIFVVYAPVLGLLVGAWWGPRSVKGRAVLQEK